MIMSDLISIYFLHVYSRLGQEIRYNFAVHLSIRTGACGIPSVVAYGQIFLDPTLPIDRCFLFRQYLHDQDITHRDLKPENILLMSDSHETLIKVCSMTYL